MTVENLVGVIGLGLMGGAVARRLLATGSRLVVYDLDASRMAQVSAGAPSGSVVESITAREVAAQAATLITILPNGPDVEAVAHGEDGVLAGARPGLLWLEMSTIDPAVTTRLAQQATGQDVTVMDAAIGGLTHQAEQGTLLLMVGGDDGDLERARPLLTQLGEIIHCGPVGAGVTIKLINNQLAGVTLAATCEALLLGRKAGLSVEIMKSVLSRTMADNAHLHRSLPDRLLPRDFVPGFRMALMVKDAGLALDLAHRHQAPDLLGAVVQELRAVALNKGLAEEDTTVLLKVLEEMAGVSLSE